MLKSGRNKKSGQPGIYFFYTMKRKKDKQINNNNNNNNNNNDKNYNLASYCSTTVQGFVLVLIFSKSQTLRFVSFLPYYLQIALKFSQRLFKVFTCSK